MKKAELCIATITLVRKPEEEALLRISLPLLSQSGLPVFVTDGGSPPAFLHFVRSLPNFTLLPASGKGVFAQARNSLREAAKTERPFIYYTEPDKEDFFRSHLLAMIEEVETYESTGVVMASRSAKGFATFPAFQQMTETAINNCCGELMGLKTDYCYGPFLLNKKLVAFLEDVKEDIGWGWRPFVFTAAHRLGYNVSSVEKDFVCPEAQRQDDKKERVYRMKQLEQNIRGLVLSAEMDSIRNRQ